MYSGVVIFCALFFCVFSSFSVREYFTSGELIKYLIANLTGMNFLCHTLPGVFNGAVINGSLWTIKIEVGFYIFLPLFIYSAGLRKPRGYIYLCWFICYLLYTH